MKIHNICRKIESVRFTPVRSAKEVARKVTPPKPCEAKRFKIVSPPSNTTPTKVQMFEKFKTYFHEDLIGFMKVRKHDKFRIVTSGGYGIKTLLEQKHGMFGKVHTSDADFTVSTYKCSMSAEQCFTYWTHKLHAFFSLQQVPSDFEMEVVNFGHAFVPVMQFHRDYVIMVSYKGKDFVDIAITNQKITHEMLDKPTSLKSGLPLKKEEYYLKEVMKLIYMENVPGVNDYSYKKRNPVTGMEVSKGIKDILRSKLLCALQKDNEKYKEYCRLLKDVTLSKLKRLPKTQRDDYFAKLKDIISPPA